MLFALISDIGNQTHKDKMNPQIKKVEVDGQAVYLRNSNIPLIGGWGVVHPIKDDNNKIVWVNLIFGGKANLFKLIIIFLLVASVLYGIYDYKQQVQVLLDQCYNTSMLNVTNFINISGGGIN